MSDQGGRQLNNQSAILHAELRASVMVRHMRRVPHHIAKQLDAVLQRQVIELSLAAGDCDPVWQRWSWFDGIEGMTALTTASVACLASVSSRLASASAS